MDNPLETELEQVQQVYNMLTEFFVNYSMQVIGAILILIAGYFVARAVSRWLIRMLEAKAFDVTLTQFLGSLSFIAVMACFVLIALGKFGISVTPFVAALGAFTLGAGLAIQGVVSNYGAGFSIIITRPFVVGNTLTVQGVSGVVEQIRLAYTVLTTEDGEKITVPNKEIVGQILENSFENKLIETVVGINLTADPEQAIKALANAIAGVDCITQDPPPQIGIDSFTEYAIKIGVRFWVPTQAYYQSKYAVNRVIYHALKAAAIAPPIPRQDVQMVS